MKLLNELIDILSSKGGSLNEALLKTKVLLHEIGHKELVEWVNFELNGYPADAALPPYRVIGCRVLGEVIGPRLHAKTYPLPIRHLEDKNQQKLIENEMREAIFVIEKIVHTDGGVATIPIPVEFNGHFDEVLAPGNHVLRAWTELNAGDMEAALVQVRSRLLDFLLALRDTIPAAATDAEAVSSSQHVNVPALFAGAIFGDNATVLVGDQNVQIAKNINIKGDFSALADLLRTKSVAEKDIEALKSAIEADAAIIDPSKKKFGPSVGQWLGGMVTKAANLAWQIEISMASNFLVIALQHYYGWQ